MTEIDVTRIAGNIGAMNSLNSLANINKRLSVHQTRLATGKRINSAADDPAGLTIATKMFSRSEGLKQAMSNIGDAKNLLAVAESGLGRVNDILVQMRNKAEAAASDTMGSNERSAIVTQLQAYAAQIDDITAQTEWNGNKLINGTYSSTKLTFQTGAGATDITQVSGLDDMSATGGLALATKSGTAGAAVSTDASDIIDGTTGVTAGDADNANLSQLQTGTYTVRVVSDGSNGGSVHLFDSGGNELLVSQTPADGTGTVAKGVTLDTSGGGTPADAAINFGNGLTVNINSGLAAGTYDSAVTFTQADSYAMTFDDGSGSVTLTGSSSAADFNKFMAYVGTKLDDVSSQLSNIGSLTGRLTFKEDQISAAQINTEAAYNRIMNANMAEEQVEASKYQILQQTATAMLAQANAAPQFLLSLFR